ncbi:hypothetical protein GUJ93_ZPchr0009g216 [Zizania palustris]|uniref:Bidirectional sugar transporter SWEET n=1 Tax=Zizania palustris TaxID=103762 RepID=A0A8J5RM87_ZIZPA|nr:hypothetical protein GUJ93_ZPchr0009g216 [Zizania palustris]
MLWIYYALIKSNEGLLIIINAAGCVIETIYIVVFITYAPKKAKLFTAKILLLLNVGVFGLILLLTMLLTHGEKRVVSLGWVCVAFSVSVFVAPLSIIRRVVQTRSVEYMPFSLSLTLTLSAVVWFLYGLLIKDKYVALPNVLGFTFGVVQMGLYMFYMNAKPVAGEGKEAKLRPAAEDQALVVDVSKLATMQEKSSSYSEVHPVTEMATAYAAVPRNCAVEAAAAAPETEVAVDMPRNLEVAAAV